MATVDVTPNIAAPDAAPVADAQPAQSNADKALEAFRASDPAAKPADQVVAPNVSVVDGKQPDTQPDPNASLEALKDDPRVIELLAQEEQFKAYQEAFQDLPYQVSNPEEAKQQLTDAGMLYDIVSGKRPASDLLKVMAANNHWTPEQTQAVYADLAQHISEATGKPVVAAAAGKPQFSDPIQQELADIKGKLTAREQAEANAEQQKEQTRVNTAFEGHIAELCKDFPDDTKFYGTRVAAKIAGNSAIVAQIAKGNFAQVRKLFTEERNADVQRFERWSKGLLTKKLDDKNKLPNQPNGGVVPQDSAPLKFKTPQEAEEHRLKMFRGQA